MNRPLNPSNPSGRDIPHMKTSSSRMGALATAISVVVAAPSFAAFVAFDTFDTYPVGALNGQGPAGNVWTAGTGATVVDAGGGDRRASMAGVNSIPNYRALGPAGLTIANASTAATVYWNFTISSGTTGNNWNFIITDLAAPTDTAGSSEVQFNYDATQASAFRARDGGAFEFLSLDGTVAGRLLPLPNIIYNAWFEINNSTDTYQIFLQSDNDPLISNRTLMFADNGTGPTFGFRNGAAANDLITANMGSGATGSIVSFDDIHVDTAGFNGVNPVPEPTNGILLGLAALTGTLRRRRK
jgi:hypothetical protein